MASGVSGHQDPATACSQVLEQVCARLEGSATSFGVLFASRYSATALEALAGRVAEALGSGAVVGMSSAAVIGGRSTIEQRPGLSLLAGSFPGVEARTFAVDPSDLPLEDTQEFDDWASELVQARADIRATLVFADPTSIAVSRIVRVMNDVCGSAPILGGLAGGVDEKQSNVVICGDHVGRGGFVGMTLSGALRVDAVVGQGCRPVGSPMVITKSHRNLIKELGGKPAIEAVREAALGFDEQERRLLAGGLYLGVAVDEYRSRFGRGDFVVRRILGGHESSGSIALDEPVRPGRTVQVHLRDPAIARADLHLLLDGQKLHGVPAGGLILSDVVRGRAMFDDDWSDASAIARAFDVARSGEDSAKGGYEIASLEGPIPAAGCLCAGEIGPMGSLARVQGVCTCVGLFRGLEEPGPREAAD